MSSYGCVFLNYFQASLTYWEIEMLPGTGEVTARSTYIKTGGYIFKALYNRKNSKAIRFKSASIIHRKLFPRKKLC